MDPNQRHQTPVGAGMTQTFPVVQPGLDFQYGRMPGFQQMQSKSVNIQGVIGNSVNTYNYISNFTGILPQGQGSMMAGVPQGQGSLMQGIPQGQASLGMMSGVQQSQGSGMAGVPQGQGSVLSGIPQGQGSVVAGVSHQVQGSVMTGVHQQGQGSLIAGATQQGQGPLLTGVPQGQGSLLANIQGAVPVNNYIPAVSCTSGGALPSMGSFVASFNQPNFNMNQYVVSNYKGGVDNWISAQPQSGNSLPSFGHFLMPQQYQQQSPRQQQPQQHQHQFQQQIFPGNQGQNRFTGNLMQQSGIGQMYSVSSSVGNAVNSNQTLGNVTTNPNYTNSSGENTNVAACQGTATLGHSEIVKLQNLHASLHPAVNQQLQNVPQMSQIPASCNQITNTTSSVITTTSSRSAAPVTANVHIKTSVSPVVVPSSLSVPVSIQSTVSDSPDSDSNMNTEQTDAASTGCDSKSNSNTQQTTESRTSSVSTSRADSSEQTPTQTVIVPFGWRRVQEESAIVYYSPSNIKLNSLQEVKQYLASEGTCKCGLECPVLVDKVFNFDPSVHSRQWSLDVHCTEDLTQLCNHKRKIIAMATFHSNKSFPVMTSAPSISGMVGSAILSTSVTSIAGQSSNKNKRETKSKKKKASQNPYDGLLVSQLLAQRDRLKLNPCKSGRTTPGQLKPENQGISSLPDAALSPGSKSQNVLGHQLNSLPSPAASDSGSQGRSSVKDPADDLGPISSGKPIKLDFSQGISQMDGLRRMNVNTPAMSPNTGTVKSGNQFMQQNPLSVQTGFQQEQFKDQVFIQQSPHTPSGHSPGFAFPQNQVTPCANFGVGIPMGASVNMHQNPGVVLHGAPHTNFPFYQLQNPTPGRYIGQNMMTGHPFHSIGQAMPGPYHMGHQQGIFHPPNAIMQSMADVGWQEPKKRQRKCRAKKDKKKVNCVFESDTPPPNVDVSQLQDHGKGPIPKVKTSPTSSSSFLENPTAFLAEQTAMISNSLTTTLSSPKASNSRNPVETSTQKETNESDTVDGDVGEVDKVEGTSTSSAEATVTTAPTVSTTSVSGNKCVSSSNTTYTSPCAATSLPVICTSSSNAPIGMSVSSTSAIGPASSDWRSSSGSSSTESHATPSLSDNNNDMFTEDRCESLSPDSGAECPALNETITPSSVVHHTATNLSPEKLKSEQGKLTSNIDKNILQSKHLSVSQIQSTVQDILTRSASVDASSHAKVSASTVNIQSQMDNIIEMAHRCNRNVGTLNPIQQMLGCQNTNEFPASNLLSAAARAQMVQQQQMGLLIGQPSHNVQVSQSFPLNMNMGIGPGGLNVPVGMEFNAKSVPGNKGMQILASEDGQMLINQQGYPVANGTGIPLQESVKFIGSISPPSKITSPVNVLSTASALTYPNGGIVSNCTTSVESQPKMVIQPLNGFTNSTLLKANQIDQLAVKQGLGSLLSQTAGQPMIDQSNINQMTGQLVSSVGATIPPVSLPLVTGVTNALTQVLPAVSGSQSNVNPQTVMNMFNNIGMNTFTNGSMMVGQFPTAVPQDGMHSVPLLNGTIPATYINNVNGPGTFPRNVPCSNGIIMDSQSGSNNAVVDLGFTAKQGQMAQMVTGETSNGFIQMKTSQSVDMSQLSNKLSVQCEEQVLQPTVVFPNIQMPLFQVLGTEQMAVNQNIDKANMQPFTLPNPAELQGMINQLQTGQAAPINLMNFQQVWNNLTTGNNLTAMQLQTLQLQQQLIQQLQGMQTLISQFNVQGNHGNAITTVANKDGSALTTAGQLTFTVTTNSCPESVVSSESKTSLVSCSNSETVAMGTMVNDVSTTSDLCGQDKIWKEDDRDSSADNLSSMDKVENQVGDGHENETLKNITSGDCEGLSSSQVVSSSCSLNKVVISLGNDNSIKSNRKDDCKNGIDISDEVTSSNDSFDNQLETEKLDGKNKPDVNTTTKPQADIASNQVLSDDCVQNQCQLEALNLSTCKSSSASSCLNSNSCSSANLHSKIESSAKSSDKCSCEKTDNIDNTQDRSSSKLDMENIYESNLKKPFDCDNMTETVCLTEKDNEGTLISLENKTIQCSPDCEDDRTGKECGNFLPSEKINTSASSVTNNNFYSGSQSCTKSSPEHHSSTAEKPVEATLPSDIITTKSMDMRNCTGMHLYQASHMVQAVELSSETAEKAADALTIVNKASKRPRDLDYVEDEPDDSTEEMSLSDYPRCFSIGDLVWGQIRGFPSWPGKVVHETEVIDGHEPESGKCWVKWFGDHTFTEVEPDKLKSLSEGLEAHHRARKKHRKGRKMNSNLEAAIHEAMIELDRQAAVTLENKTQSKVIVQKGKLSKKKRTR